MLYSSLVGQNEAKNRLIKMVQSGRVPHALLFTGPDGCGHLSAAVTMSAHLLCKNPQENEPCGTCPSCNKVFKLIHPDVHFVFPIIKSKNVKTSNDLLPDFREAFTRNAYLSLNDWISELDADNKQLLIPTDESADILKKLSYTSFEGSYKIMIIWQAERMNTEAANRLLKVLEEPPDETVFILVSSQPDQLLATILSRVQHIPFYQVEESVISEALVKHFQVSKEVADQAAFISGGNFHDAMMALYKDEESVSLLSRFQNFMRLAIKFDCSKALVWIDENASLGREKQKDFITYALAVFRDAIMFNFGERSLVKLSGSEKQFLEKFAPFINTRNYQQLVEEYNQAYYYVERNANPKILFMDLLMKTNDYLSLKG